MKTQHEDTATANDRDVLLRVAGGSQVKKVAGAIVKNLREKKVPHLIAIGAGAVNQAIKAVCVARGMVGPEGKSLSIVPGFRDEDVHGNIRTAIVMKVVTD